ncbi:hypothetical protein ABIF65_007384 [Bradyrhizobium japonicum]|nr:hypothetical protein [Bradyrhizobium japonicum]WLB98876.1 hypothetical protein QIH92_05175 [Bradyrhizobium japonicum USDA 123]MCP1745709.1 hypothetical protein [Bradyrhizobium japonicum]MCP1863342.1 hypothetical protein [Bradyrhizobium japonicum]MCP1894196.1 hypothetical protein [Bradyrhizobium japonicum]MCW2327313.1 hypothetical protein [Bradyrhizobium japonicum]
MMPSRQNLYDLYGSTSLLNLERRIAEGKIPTAEELAAVLEANSAEPLPAWFSALVVKSLRGELKKRGRPPKDDALFSIRFQLARAKYRQYLTWLQKRERAVGLKGWPAVRDQKWWTGPPHERAARMASARWLRHMDWRAFLNRVSSS